MKPPLSTNEPSSGTPRDFSLAGACLLCGGDLQVRVGPGRAATFCAACRWISRPHMRRGEEGNVHVIHPAGLVA